jgi:hypothetical protein
MPIYEYYCPDNHRIYQFYAKTLAQGQTVPRCPDNPAYRLVKILSPFAVTRGSRAEGPAGSDQTPSPDEAAPSGDDARADAAMAAMEGEFAGVDENDPRAMGRMMRRMAELTGEKMAGEMEEVVRKLEEGADPESLEEQLGGADDPAGDPAAESGAAPITAGRPRRRAPRRPPQRDPQLYDYE